MDNKKISDQKIKNLIQDAKYDVADNAFNANATLSSTNRYKYNGFISKANKSVESLDRFDDFAELKISPKMYQKKDDIYGIEFNKKVHLDGADSIILEHQQKAAEVFLRELRGFGLLADVVGSGKTFEAGVVVSELAIRNKIQTMLFIVPKQVIDTWQNVMELKFGLGKGAFLRIDYEEDKDNSDISMIETDSNFRPLRPILVEDKAFACWSKESANMLFDVIVVDEAHNLCIEDGEYAKAMELLSLMMVTKKKHNKSYCVLLSATPHSGNLDNMFRLWYFIRCKGGSPSDFENTSAHSSDFLKEKKYYHESICRGAVTVKEFIDIVRRDYIVSNYREIFVDWVRKNEINPGDLNILKTKFEYAVKNNEKINIDYFMRNYLDAFYQDLEDESEIKEKTTKYVAKAYHEGVLRTIMIRQPNKHMRKTKISNNYLFYPTYNSFNNTYEFYHNMSRLNIKVDLAKLDTDEAICITDVDDSKMSLMDYAKRVNNGRPQQVVADLLFNNILAKIDNGKDNPIFKMLKTSTYYSEQINRSTQAIRYSLNPVKYKPNSKLENKVEMFKAKFNKTLELLNKHSNERVIIYFDYETKKQDSEVDWFIDALKATSLKDRILIGNPIIEDIQKTISKFDSKEDSILIVTTPAFTEGANLQKSRVIINFQISPDPLAMDQRIGRIFRLGQESDNVVIYSLVDMSNLEGYVLMYFLRIGLLSSNNGDVTIIAGSNNDRMVAVRCKKCQNVKLLSLQDYEDNKNAGIFCHSDMCKDRSHPDGLPMDEITVYDFKCDKCNSLFARSVTEGQEGYLCLANTTGERGVMANSGEKGDRKLYCRKICSISHCQRFVEEYSCPALKAYQKKPSIGDTELFALCVTCPNKCPEECRLTYKYENPIASIKNCRKCNWSNCSPRPHVLLFNEKWECECPTCGSKGKLKPIVARTFATYIRGAWNFAGGNKEENEKRKDKGEFCENLKKEVEKVADIKKILDTDGGDE